MDMVPMKRHLRAPFVAALLAATGVSTSCGHLFAQCCGPTLSIQPKVIMEEQYETRHKLVYETAYTDEEVVSHRPILRYRAEKRNVSVTKPVVETSVVQETYTVMTPVVKREMVDRSYYKIDYVTETSQREEVYTTLQPVMETQYQIQQYVVQKPVTETQYQTQQYTTYSPVTTYQTATIDQGQYVAQPMIAPGASRYRLGFLPGGTAVDTATGLPFYHRSQFGWVPQQAPATAYTALYYQPNLQQVAVPQTTLVPQVQQQQVPVQVTRMESEVVQQQVPVSVTKMQPIEQRRMVPYTTQKPVQQYVEHKEPVERIEYVQQQMVRPKTVQNTSYKTENVVQEYQVPYYEMEEVRTRVRVPRQVTVYKPETVRRLVPRTVYSPIALNYFDPYSSAIVQGFSSWAPVISSPATVPAAPAASSGTTTSPSDATNSSSASPQSPQQSVKKVEVGELPKKTEAEETKGLELKSSSGDGAGEIPKA